MKELKTELSALERKINLTLNSKEEIISDNDNSQKNDNQNPDDKPQQKPPSKGLRMEQKSRLYN